MATSPVHTYTVERIEPFIAPERAISMAVPFAPNLSLAKGTVLGIITASKLYAAYNNALATGVEVAKAILRYTITTDASGNVTIHGEQGETSKTAPVWWGGCFKESELVGLDAGAIVDLTGRSVDGVFIF